MMHSIREAFDQEVAELPWIDDATRPAIYDKVATSISKMSLLISSSSHDPIISI